MDSFPTTVLSIDTGVSFSVVGGKSGDFNGDGNLDILLDGVDTDTGDGAFFLLLVGDGTGNFTERSGVVLAVEPGSSSSLVVGDFDGNGTTDIALASSDISGSDQVAIALGIPESEYTGGDGFAAGKIVPVPIRGSFLTLGAKDANGADTIVATSATENNLITSRDIQLAAPAIVWSEESDPSHFPDASPVETVYSPQEDWYVTTTDRGGCTVQTFDPSRAAGSHWELLSTYHCTETTPGGLATGDLNGNGGDDLAVIHLGKDGLIIANHTLQGRPIFADSFECK